MFSPVRRLWAGRLSFNTKSMPKLIYTFLTSCPKWPKTKLQTSSHQVSTSSAKLEIHFPVLRWDLFKLLTMKRKIAIFPWRRKEREKPIWGHVQVTIAYLTTNYIISKWNLIYICVCVYILVCIYNHVLFTYRNVPVCVLLYK